MTTESTIFEVEIAPQRANTGTMANVVRESFRALIGFDANVIITQTSDRTLEVTITGTPS